MELRDILALEANTSSIKKIDQFLSNKAPNDRDYPRALAHLAYLTYSLGDVSNSFQLLFSYLEFCPDKEKTVIYNTLIKIYYQQEDYDNVIKMIELKKAYLPSYNKNAYYEDLITYYQTINNQTELRRNLLIYLNDDITDEKRLSALLTLSNSYFHSEEYESFMVKNKLIQSLALSLKEEAIYQEACCKEAYVLVITKSYPEALIIIEELLNDNISKEIKASLITLKLKIYVELGEFRKASILEAEFESDVLEGDNSTKLMFAEECIKLYTALNNRFNKNTYEEKYRALLELKSETNIDSKPKKQKSLKHKIELNFAKNQTIDNRPNTVIKPVERAVVSPNINNNINYQTIKTEEATLIETSSQLDVIANLFIELNNQVFSQFRDYLRQFFIILSKVCYFDEAYLLVKNDRYYGYHYKKERLYDKKDPFLNDTIFLDCIDSEEEIVVPSTNETSYVNIINNKLYKDLTNESAICFPLSSGALLFNANESTILTKKLNYETLKLACAYLETKYNAEVNEVGLLNKYHDYIFMIEHMNSGYKRQIDNYIYLSKRATEMFKCNEAITLNEFYQTIYNEDVIGYQKVINDLLIHRVDSAKFRYRSNRTGVLRYYEEDFMIDQNDVILSVINDITETVKKDEESLFMAVYDPLSGLYNKSKLNNDLALLIEGNKFSLFALNIKDFKRYNDIYGYDFGDQLIFSVGKYIKEFDNELTCYHLDGDKFVVAINGQNDKRSMIKLAYKLAEYLTLKLRNLNYRLNIYFEVGILRYPTDTTEKSQIKLIDYLLSALSGAYTKEIKTNVMCYDKEFYKKQFFESQLVTHISEAIDNNHLVLDYRQVIDIKNQTCDHYKVSINLSNYSVSQDMIYNVLNKRNMISVLERYIIHKVLYEFAELYREIKVYFNVSVTLSKETLLDPTIKDYILEQISFFKLPPSTLTIRYEDSVDEEVLKVLKSLYLNQVSISTTNVDLIKLMPVTYFYYVMPKTILDGENDFIIMLKNYCDSKNISFVLENTRNQQIISHYSPLGFSLYSGEAYNAVLSYNEIIKAFLS